MELIFNIKLSSVPKGDRFTFFSGNIYEKGELIQGGEFDGTYLVKFIEGPKPSMQSEILPAYANVSWSPSSLNPKIQKQDDEN